MAGPADVVKHNREAWDLQVAGGNRWTIPATPLEISRAREGRWGVYLTPNIQVPAAWFLPMAGCRILCLASGGGQQGPIFAAAGAHVTVLDNSPAQLANDQRVAVRHALSIRTVLGDMADLSCFEAASFDLVFHPVSNVFAPDVRPVYREAARVLRDGGVLLAGFNNPAMYIFDQQAAERGELVARHSLPYSDIGSLEPRRVAELLARKIPLEFSHTLEEQLNGQCEAGLAITGMYEDHDVPSTAHPLDRFMPLYLATRAAKQAWAAGELGSRTATPSPVDRDLPCVRCGYNLRTMDGTARCPECGAGVALTLELGGELQRTRPAYLGRLATGCWMLFAARVAATISLLVSARIDHWAWLPVPLMFFATMYSIGTFLLTGREHPRLRPEMAAVSVAMRICAGILVVGSAVLGLFTLTVALHMSGSSFLVSAALVIGTSVAMWLAYSVFQVLEMSLLVRLSRRVSDASLREHAIIAGVGATASGLVFGAFFVLSSTGLMRRMGTSDLSLVLVLMLLVSVLLFWLWTGYVSLVSALHLTRSWKAASARWQKNVPVQA